MRRNVIPWPCEPASSIAVVAAFCLAFFALPSIPVMAQTVLVPDPLPFDAFVESQLPGLTVARDKAFPSGIFRLSLDDPRRKMLAVDSHTGLVIPDSPFPPMELLPKNDPRTREYSQKLREFLERREQLLQLRVQYLNLLGDKRRLELQNAAALNHNDYFSAKVTKWNGDIFWRLRAKQRTSLFVLATKFDPSSGRFRHLTLRPWGRARLPTGRQLPLRRLLWRSRAIEPS